MDRAQPRPRRGRRAPVRAALVALACVPTAGLVVQSTATAVERSRTADDAADVRAEADRLLTLVQLRFAMSDEKLPSLSLAVSSRLGLEPAVIEEALGFDLVGRMASARRAVDRLAPAVGEPAVLDALPALERGRRELDAGTVDADWLSDTITAAESAANLAVFESLEELRREAAELSGAGELDRRLAVLEDAVEAQRSALSQTGSLGSLLIPGVSATSSVLDFAGDMDRFTVAAGQLDATVVGPTAERWRAFRADPDVRRFEAVAAETLDRRLSGESLTVSGTEDALALGPTFRAGLDRAALLNEFVRAASGDVDEAADRLRDGALAGFRRTLAVAGGLVLLTAFAVVVTARSISRPLRRLAHHADVVTGGSLEVGVLDERGPREVAVVTGAFNEIVANLRAVETQVGALAAGAVDDPVLRQTLPGRLGEAVQASVRQLSELQRRLAHEATHDSLTGLLNRPAALAELDAALAGPEGTAVLFLDLDWFKAANDTYGHAVGDAVLQETGRRLVATVRDGDRVARLGGDEFVVVAAVSEAEEGRALAERLVAALAEPFPCGDAVITIGTSIGVAVAPPAGVASLDLLGDADAALYRAKTEGKGCVVVFGPEPLAVPLPR